MCRCEQPPVFLRGNPYSQVIAGQSSKGYVTISLQPVFLMSPSALRRLRAAYDSSSLEISSRWTPPSQSRSISHAIYAECEFWNPRRFALRFHFSSVSSGMLIVVRTILPCGFLGLAIRTTNEGLDVIAKGRETLFFLPFHGLPPKLGRHGNGGSDGLFALTFCFHFIPSMTGNDPVTRNILGRKASRANGLSHPRNFFVAFNVISSY